MKSPSYTAVYYGVPELVGSLVDIGILKEQPSKARNKLFSAQQIPSLLS